MIKAKKLLFFIASILLVFSLTYTSRVYAQACDPSTPTFTFDLTGSPGGTWISPRTVRSGLCCGLDPNASPPIRCVEFNFTLDPESQGIKFDIASGAVPRGSMGYQINCGPYKQVGEIVCLDGPGPWRLTFCKPGNNPNTYSIKSIPKPSVSPPVTVSSGCTGTISAYGYDVSTIKWSSVPFNAVHNSYLSCTEKCENVTATMQVGAPPFVDYEVSGFPPGGCSNVPVTKRTRVYFVDDKVATITPNQPSICFGSSNVTLTVTASGGQPPYKYKWSTGATTQAISAAAGTYSVEVFDNTSCPSAKTSVTVTTFASPITANAGPDVVSCANNAAVNLQGSVTGVTEGIWSGGLGTYSPSNTSLNVSYTPSAAEISSGSVNHTLTTTGNRDCPPASDVAVQRITPPPTITIAPASGCADQFGIQLGATVNVATGGTWSTSGSGYFSPNNSVLNPVYIPSAADKTNGSVTHTITSTGNGTCLPVTDSKALIITPPPTVNAGLSKTMCYDENSVAVNGSVTIATGGVWSTNGTGSFSNPITLSSSYLPSVADKDNGNVILTLTTTGNGSCNPVRDTLTIIISPRPIVTAGPGSLCNDEASVPLNGSVLNASGGVWTTNGSGSFLPDNTRLNGSYAPSTADRVAGTIQLTLTSTGNKGCNPVSAVSNIVVTPRPVVNAGPDQTVCSSTSTVNLNGSVSVATGGVWSSTGSGTFSSTTNLNTTYTLSPSDQSKNFFHIVLTSTGNGGCSPVIDSVKITIQGAISNQADLTSICYDETEVSLSAVVYNATNLVWSAINGTGTFPNGTSGNGVKYMPSIPDKNQGFVDFNVTTPALGACPGFTSQVKVTILPRPISVAGPDQDVCKNINSISLNGNVQHATGGTWSTTGGGTFNNPDILNPTYNISNGDKVGGKVFLIFTTVGNGNCNPVRDTVVLSIYDSFPTADAGGDTAICANISSIQLKGSVTGATGGLWSSSGTGTFIPSATALDAVYQFANSDKTSTLTLTLTTTGNNCATNVGSSKVMFVSPPTSVFSGRDTLICTTISHLDLKGTIAGATIGAWSTSGSGAFVPNKSDLTNEYYPSAADKALGSINITLTAAGVCSNTPHSFKLSFFDPTLVVNAGNDTTLCTTNSALKLKGSVLNGSGSVWTTSGSGTFSNPALPDAMYTPSVSDMGFGEVTLTLTGSSSCGDVIDRMTYSIIPGPNATINGRDAICADINEVALSATLPNQEDIVWSTNGGGAVTPSLNDQFIRYFPTPQDRTNGSVSFTLRSINNGGCPASVQTVNLVINPLPEANAGADQIVCQNNSIQLSAALVENATYTWFCNTPPIIIMRSQRATVMVDHDTTFHLLVTDNNNCYNMDSIDVFAIPKPILDISDTTGCQGQILTLRATPTNPSTVGALIPKYSWMKDGFRMIDSTETIKVTTPGTYIGNYKYGLCSTEDTSKIFFKDAPLTNMVDEVKFCKEDQGTVILDAGSGAYYSWLNTIDSTRYLTVSNPNYYYVKVFNENNCYTLDSINVRNVCPPKIFVPKAFTPEISGENNVFKIFGTSLNNFRLTIFNRWGEIIYYTEDREKFWNGFYKGELMPMGLYPWTITYEDISEDSPKKILMKGSVTVLR